MEDMSRREFIATGSAAITLTGTAMMAGGASTPSAALQHGAGDGPGPSARHSPPPGSAPIDGPVVVASGNGYRENGDCAVVRAAEIISRGGDPLDAVVAGVNLVEEDPSDQSVGYGGLPNEDGIVELDASVMHGPLHRSGAVAALQNIKTPSSVARLVLQRTDHCLLVGAGALKFAKAHGFKEEDLLTEESRKAWLKWKETLNPDDDWIPPEVDEEGRQSAAWRAWPFSYGTINCCARTPGGDLAGVTTTSGLSYKLPGRVGDSPIIGAGLYVDNDVGAAGSTGRGEAVIQVCGAYCVVEAMRNGKSPQQACLEACQRIADKTKLKRLRTQDGRPNFGVIFYAVHKDGRFGAASIWNGPKYAVFAGGQRMLLECAYLYEKK